jgi:alcohol dehydrogenase class IV
MPDRLSLVGVKRNQFDLIAKNAMLDRWVHANPRKISRPEDVLEILELAA